MQQTLSVREKALPLIYQCSVSAWSKLGCLGVVSSAVYKAILVAELEVRAHINLELLGVLYRLLALHHLMKKLF